MPEAFTCTFDASESRLALLGGKACNLGELTRAGFAVPSGFTVTTKAYRLCAERAGLSELLVRLAEVPAGEHERLVARAGELRAAIAQTPLDESVATEIAAAYRSLGSEVAVAVRSSATAEDLATLSFAGQQDTYLDVVGEAAVFDAVRRCWASLFNDRAAIYRARNGIASADVNIAVAVQRMVAATTAGVLFTANPVSGRRSEAVVEASPGLGEAVVSGAVNPDRFVLDKASGRLLESQTGEGLRAPCLTPLQLRQLVELGVRAEAHFQSPQDIEFALDERGLIWVLQARPITTLFPVPRRPAGAESSGGELRVYVSATADEGVTRPITPMGLAAFRVLAGAAAELFFRAGPADRAEGPAFVAEAAFRTYYDITPLLQSRPGRALARAGYGATDAHTSGILRTLEKDPRLTRRSTRIGPLLRAALMPFLRTPLLLHLVKCLIAPERVRRKDQAAFTAVLAGGHSWAAATAAERLEAALTLLWDGSLIIPWVLGEAVAGFVALRVVGLLLGRRASDSELQIAMRGLANNPTTQMNLALWELAETLRSDSAARAALRDRNPVDLAGAYRASALPPELQLGLGRLLERYGHRAVAEVDLGLPRWSEDPTYLFGVLANYLRSGDGQVAPDRLWRRAEEEARAMVVSLVARCRGPRRALVRLVLDRARALGGVREQWKFDLSALYAAARQLLLTVGRELVEGGRLDDEADIFFVSFQEARCGLTGSDLRAIVRRRQEEYRAELGRRRIPAIILSDGSEPVPDLPFAPSGGDAAGELVGTPASPGRVRGPVRVLNDPVGARIEPGEILVAPSTDPGWTPLFMTAGGLVMEKGGTMSHGAVVAREVGIPAVVGVAGATSRLATGQVVEVDGAAGRVFVV